MRVFFDTSVLVAAMAERHPAHEISLPWLQRVKVGTDTGVISAHTIAELFSVLTTLPVRPCISPVVARHLIQENVLKDFEVITLSGADYADLLAHLASVGIVGGMTYDALILHAATKADADSIETLNERHFRQAYPALVDKLVTPQ